MMIPGLVRTAADLKAARAALGLTADGLAHMLRVEDGRTVRRWEAGEREIPGPVSVVMETAMDFLRQRVDLAQQLDRLSAGTMRPHSMSWDSNIQTNGTDASIARVSEAIRSLDDALVILTRQPQPEASNAVHWYTLRRSTPRHRPPEKDEWTLPGETSVRAALAYFEHETGMRGLEVCDPTAADFVLEQRVANRRQVGASFRIRPGELIQEFPVGCVAAHG